MTDTSRIANPGRKHATRWVVFAALTMLGLIIMAAAWTWLTLASSEQASEAAKAGPGDSSTQGIFLLFGVIPLVSAHLLGLVILHAAYPKSMSNSLSRWTVSAAVVVVASVAGCIIALSLNGGHLLTPAGGGFTP